MRSGSSDNSSKPSDAGETIAQCERRVKDAQQVISTADASVLQSLVALRDELAKVDGLVQEVEASKKYGAELKTRAKKVRAEVAAKQDGHDGRQQLPHRRVGLRFGQLVPLALQLLYAQQLQDPQQPQHLE